ncbi:hypothetical protein PQR16_25160 [Caballeronia glebae]
MHVFTGNDNIQDAGWPYGNGDMLQRAMLIGYRSGFYTDDELLVALHMATHAGAAVLGMDAYGLKAGNDATFVIVDALNAAAAAAAVAAVPAQRVIVRGGRFQDDSSRLQFESGKVGHQHGVGITTAA